MLREPIGKKQVGISELDTIYFGEEKYHRKLSLMFFYPTDEKGAMYPYKDVTYQKNMALSRDQENGVKTFCYQNVPLSSEKTRYPVIMYHHGLTGFQMESTVLCADLASNGYIVVSVGHPYGSGAITYTDGSLFEPDNPFVFDKYNLAPLGELWYEDIYHAIETLYQINKGQMEDTMFSQRMDIEKGVHLLGVSFGGCCSIGASLIYDHIRSAINLDGGLFTTLTPKYIDRPILVLCSPRNLLAHAKLKELGCKNVQVKKIRKITHWEFSDGIYLSDKGKNDRGFADKVSKNRTEICLAFLEQVKKV